MQDLIAHLRTLDRDQLTALLTERPDAIVTPVPQSLPELAFRLAAPHSLASAVAQLDTAALNVLEAVAALGAGATEETLATLLGVDDRGLRDLYRHTVDTLRRRALLITTPDGTLRLCGELGDVWDAPLDLGAPLAETLPELTADQLRRIAHELGLQAGKRKAETAARIVVHLADPGTVRDLVASAPPPTRELLHTLAWDGPVLESAVLSGGFVGWRGGGTPERWAVDRGLLLPGEWHVVEMPAEVALALRGPDYRAPFTPPPPAPPRVTVAADRLAAATAAGVAGAVGAAARVLDQCEATPPALTKQGRLGAREVRRLAKTMAMAEPETQFWCGLIWQAGLLSAGDGKLVLAAGADAWRAATPAERLVGLLDTWWHSDDEHAALRQSMLGALVSLPAGEGIADRSSLAGHLSWRWPLPCGEPEAVAAGLPDVWADAERLGLVAGGVATPLGRALASGDAAAVGRAAVEYAPTLVAVASYGSDLTAVVAGVPSPAVAALLDGAATRESHGAATVWRFTPATVRAAMDAGLAPDDLLAQLAAVATGTLPQTLEYLVKDVGRRHGAVRVGSATAFLTSDDTALLAEIAATRTLSRLGLRTLAPTVLVSAEPPGPTLEALRRAGYAPVEVDATGAVTVSRPARSRAQPAPGRPRGSHASGTRTSVEVPVPAEVANRLLAAPETGPAGLFGNGSAHGGVAHAARLTPGEQRVLAHAVETGALVRIDYVNATGSRTTRVVEPMDSDGRHLVAWCHLRNAERMFSLDRIRAASPV